MWDQRLHVAVGLDDGVRMLPVRLAGTSVEVPQATGLGAPLFVLPAGDGVGYGRFDIDARSLEYLVRHLPDLENGRTRGSAWLTLWEAMLEDRVSARDVVGMALRALPRETDELNVQRALTYTKQAFWKFLSEEERAAVAPDVERVLRAGLDAAPTESRKAAWFATLRDTAQSRPVLEWLERVWRKTLRGVERSVGGKAWRRNEAMTLATPARPAADSRCPRLVLRAPTSSGLSGARSLR